MKVRAGALRAMGAGVPSFSQRAPGLPSFSQSEFSR